MECSPVAIAELEGAGHIVRYVNPAFCRLVGRSKEALIGNPFAATVQDGDTCLTALDRVFRTGESEFHTEPEHTEPHPAYWSYALWPVLGPDRHPVAVMMQVTETTRFHQQAGAMNEALVLSSVRQHELTEIAEKLNERIGMLLQELTHRVKNSLQLIGAMVMIEARSHKSGEGRAALERVSNRITALGQLYSTLSKADSVEDVDAATYLDELCRDLIESVHKEGDTSVVLKTDIESELLPTDRAIPIGLIVNELVTNAVKYAFPGETKGTVMVTLKRLPGELRLTVADDGRGLDPRRADSGLGGRLVDGFAEQLGGQVERRSDSQGTTVHLILPSP